MIAAGTVTGLIYLFCHFVSFKLCSDWLFWHYSDHISVYIYGSRKIRPGKIPTRKIPTYQNLPWKIPPGKFSPRKFPPGIFPPISLSFFTLASLNTLSINGEGKENVHVNYPRMNILRFWKFWLLQNGSMFQLEKK